MHSSRKTILDHSPFPIFLTTIVFVWLLALFYLPGAFRGFADSGEGTIISAVWRIQILGVAVLLIPPGIWFSVQMSRLAPKLWAGILYFLGCLTLGEVFRRNMAHVVDEFMFTHSFGGPELWSLALGVSLLVYFIGWAIYWQRSKLVRDFFITQPKPEGAPAPLYSDAQIGSLLGLGATTFFVIGLVFAAGWIFDKSKKSLYWNDVGAELSAACPGDGMNYLCFAQSEVTLNEEGKVVESDAPWNWTVLTASEGNFKIRNLTLTNTSVSLTGSHFGDQKHEVQLILPTNTWMTPAHYPDANSERTREISIAEAGLQLTLPQAGSCYGGSGQFDITQLTQDTAGKVTGVTFQFEQLCKNGRKIIGRACIGCDGGEVNPPRPLTTLRPRERQAFLVPGPPERTIAPQVLNAVCPSRGESYACVTSASGELIQAGIKMAFPDLVIEAAAEEVDIDLYDGIMSLAFGKDERNAAPDRRITIQLRPPVGEYPLPGEYVAGLSPREGPHLALAFGGHGGREVLARDGRFLLQDLAFNVDGSIQSLTASFEIGPSEFGPKVYGRVCYRCDNEAWQLDAAQEVTEPGPKSPGLQLTIDALDALCPPSTPNSWCLLTEAGDRRATYGQLVGDLMAENFTLRSFKSQGEPEKRGEDLMIGVEGLRVLGGHGPVTVRAPYGEKLRIGHYSDIGPVHGSPLRSGMPTPTAETESVAEFEIFHLARNASGEIVEIGLDFARHNGKPSTVGRVCVGCPAEK